MSAQLVFILFVLFAIWLGGLTYFLYRTISHYQRLVQSVKKEKLSDILDTIIEALSKNKESIEKIKREMLTLEEEGICHIQKVSVLRFNPFADTGGDQSFILAILDGKNTGIVLTSLHNRGVTRWYAKNVKEGKGVDYKLSAEEEKTIKQAVSLTFKKI